MQRHVQRSELLHLLVALQMPVGTLCHPRSFHSLITHVKTVSYTGHEQKRTIHLFQETLEGFRRIISVYYYFFTKIGFQLTTLELVGFETENVHSLE